MLGTRLVKIIDPRLQLSQDVFTTLEGENPGGSIKDRMVWGELSELLDGGDLKPGDDIAEISAGSTALSLAYYSQLLGLKCHLFVPQTLESKMLERLSNLQATLHFFADVKSAYEEFDQFIQKSKIRKFNQFGNLQLLLQELRPYAL